MEYYSAIKKEQNNTICSSMDGPRDTKQSKSERERQIPYDVTYMWNLKYNTNEHICEKQQTHRHREQTCVCVAEGKIGSLGLADANYYV